MKNSAVLKKGGIMQINNKKKIIIISLVVIAVFLIARRKIELMHAPVVGESPVIVHAVVAKKQDIK